MDDRQRDEMRRTPAGIRFAVRPRRLLAGLSLVALGGLLTSLPLAGGGASASLAAIVAGLGIVVAGAAALYGCVHEVCARCREPLAASSLRFAGDYHEQILQAIRGPDPLRVVELSEIPAAPEAALTLARLDCELCPRCRQVGRLQLVRLDWSERQGRFLVVQPALALERSAWVLQQIARLSEPRPVDAGR